MKYAKYVNLVNFGPLPRVRLAARGRLAARRSTTAVDMFTRGAAVSFTLFSSLDRKLLHDVLRKKELRLC